MSVNNKWIDFGTGRRKRFAVLAMKKCKYWKDFETLTANVWIPNKTAMWWDEFSWEERPYRAAKCWDKTCNQMAISLLSIIDRTKRTPITDIWDVPDRLGNNAPVRGGGCIEADLQLEEVCRVSGQQTFTVMAAGRKSSVILLNTWIIHLTFPHSYITSFFFQKRVRKKYIFSPYFSVICFTGHTLGYDKSAEPYGNCNKLQSSSQVECDYQRLPPRCRTESMEQH